MGITLLQVYFILLEIMVIYKKTITIQLVAVFLTNLHISMLVLVSINMLCVVWYVPNAFEGACNIVPIVPDILWFPLTSAFASQWSTVTSNVLFNVLSTQLQYDLASHSLFGHSFQNYHAYDVSHKWEIPDNSKMEHSCLTFICSKHYQN